jgi:hypothetical protein
VTPEQFERFAVSEFLPALRSLGAPGVEFGLLKGIRGPLTGEYQFMMIFDSVRTRDRYFPEETRASDELIALIQPLRELSEVWEGLSEREKTDWLQLGGPKSEPLEPASARPHPDGPVLPPLALELERLRRAAAVLDVAASKPHPPTLPARRGGADPRNREHRARREPFLTSIRPASSGARSSSAGPARST